IALTQRFHYIDTSAEECVTDYFQPSWRDKPTASALGMRWIGIKATGRSNRMDRITELRPGQIRRELQRYMCASLPERVMIPASMRLRRCSEGVRRLIRCTARFNATWRGTFLGVAFTLPFLDPLRFTRLFCPGFDRCQGSPLATRSSSRPEIAQHAG